MRSVRGWAAVGAVAAIAAALGACSPDGEGGPTAGACATPPSIVDAEPAAGAGALRIAESGHTQLGPDKTVVSLGAILENTGDQVAYRARITFRVSGAGGASVVPAASGELLTQEVPVILPKQRIAVGAWTYVEGQVTAVAVEIGPTAWVPRSAAFADVATTFQALSRTGTDPETASVSYTVKSGYCRDVVQRGAAMVFRDPAGAIVGGSFELGAATCPRGESTQRSTAQRSAPAGIADAKTQISVYCDFAPKTGGGAVN